MRYFSGTIPTWLILHGDFALTLSIVALSILGYFYLKPGAQLQKALRWLILGSVIGRILLAAYLSVGQYFTWESSEFGKLFLPPNQGWHYFISYITERYWMALILGLLLAGLWFGFLKLVGARSERYLDEGEIELTSLMLFAAGWPQALILAPLVGILLVIFSIVRSSIFKRQYTTLGIPFMVGTLIILLYGEKIRSLIQR